MSSMPGKHDGPPRPPKVKDEGPLVPQRGQKVNGGQQTYAEHIAARSGKNRSSNYERVSFLIHISLGGLPSSIIIHEIPVKGSPISATEFVLVKLPD